MQRTADWRGLVVAAVLVAACGACSSGSHSTTTVAPTGPAVSGVAGGPALSQTMTQGDVAVRVPPDWSTGKAPPPDNLVASVATSGQDQVKITVVDGPFDAISSGVVGDPTQPNVSESAVSGHQAMTMVDTSGTQVIDEIIVDVDGKSTALIIASGPSGDRALLEAILATTSVNGHLSRSLSPAPSTVVGAPRSSRGGPSSARARAWTTPSRSGCRWRPDRRARLRESGAGPRR